METIMFFATLICALLLGLSYGVLYLRDRSKNYNKLELTLLKIPTPPIKIIITILIPALLALGWNEATYLVDSTGMKFLLLIWNSLSVYLLALFAYILIHPSLLKNPSPLTLCNKYFLAHNLSAMILFVILSIVALWWASAFFHLEWNIAAIGVAGIAVFAVYYVLYSLAAIFIFIYYLIIGLYHFAKWLNKTYWHWVLEH